MMYHSSLTQFFAFLATSALVLSAGIPLRVAGDVRSLNNVHHLSFKGEVDGHAYELNGTAQQVWAQLKERYPEIQLKNVKYEEVKLAKRNKVQPPLCIPVPGQNWDRAYFPDILNCYQYLTNLNARIAIVGHSCQPICCAAGQEVELCNDNDYEINPASPYLATYAYDIAVSCQTYIDGYLWAGGQEFDTDRYNIIVKGGSQGVC